MKTFDQCWRTMWALKVILWFFSSEIIIELKNFKHLLEWFIVQ